MPPAAGPPAPAPAEPAAAAPQLSPEQRKALADELEIARLFQGRGDLVRAREAYRRILEVDPTHAEARAGLAEVERSPGR